MFAFHQVAGILKTDTVIVRERDVRVPGRAFLGGKQQHSTEGEEGLSE